VRDVSAAAGVALYACDAALLILGVRAWMRRDGVPWRDVLHPSRQWRIWREARAGVTWGGNGWYEALMNAPEGPRER
jgi:hypothetical protein